MSLRDRLVLTLVAVAIALSLPALHALQRLSAIQEIAYELREEHAEAEVAATRLRARLDAFEVAKRGYVAAGDSGSRAAAAAALRLARFELDRLRTAGYARESAPVARALDALRDDDRRLDSLVVAGDLENATDFFFDRLRPRLAEAEAELAPLADEIGRRSTRTVLRAAEMVDTASRTVTLALLVCLGVALVIGILLTRSMVGPLARLRAAMARVARGDFHVPDELSGDRADELGELARSFRAMTEQLDELERVRAEFVDIVTHDLKNPLHVAAGYAELLEDGVYGDLTPGQEKSVKTVREQLGILLDQVNQLLDLSRYESGRQRLQIEPTPVGDLCRDLREAFQAPARHQGIDFRVEVDPGAPETIAADRDRLLRDLLGNLVGNALDFTPPGGTVRVRVAGDDGRIDFLVEDTGTGIPPEDLPRVFEKYFQAKNRARNGGSGMGLAIARQVTEMHGGTIGVESEVGKGTRLLVSLPVQGPGSEAPLPDPRPAVVEAESVLTGPS